MGDNCFLFYVSYNILLSQRLEQVRERFLRWEDKPHGMFYSFLKLRNKAVAVVAFIDIGSSRVVDRICHRTPYTLDPKWFHTEDRWSIHFCSVCETLSPEKGFGRITHSLLSPWLGCRSWHSQLRQKKLAEKIGMQLGHYSNKLKNEQVSVRYSWKSRGRDRCRNCHP